MKVTIITICFNNEKEIVQTIKSVVDQTYPNIEYIIIDGASKDNTLILVNQFKMHISKIISEPDNGIYDAINKGIEVAKGDIVGLIHAGDELHDNFVVEKIVNHFKKNNIDALYGHSKILLPNSNHLLRVNKSPNYKHQLFRLGWFPSHQSFYVKRNIFERFGNYNLKYKIASDYEFLFRLLYINNLKVKLLDEFIIKFKLGGKSSKSLKNIIQLNKECNSAWNDNGLQMPFYTIPLKLFRKIVQIFIAKISKYD